MIKVIVHIAKAIVTVITMLLFLSSCDGEKLDGSGNVIRQERKVPGEFTSVSVEKNLIVVIEQAKDRSITVEADDNLQEHITVEVKGDELIISSDVNIRNGAKTVIVHMPEIKGIEASSGSSVSSNNVLKSDNLTLDSGSGSSMNVTIDADFVKCESGSGSSIKVQGMANKLEAESGSGSNIDARGLKAKKVVADASSGSNLTVNPIENLSASASSGGKVYYVKTPNELSKKVSSGGSVSQAN